MLTQSDLLHPVVGIKLGMMRSIGRKGAPNESLMLLYIRGEPFIRHPVSLCLKQWHMFLAPAAGSI